MVTEKQLETAAKRYNKLYSDWKKSYDKANVLIIKANEAVRKRDAALKTSQELASKLTEYEDSLKNRGIYAEVKKRRK